MGVFFAVGYVLLLAFAVGMSWAVSERDTVLSLLFGGAAIIVGIIWLALEDWFLSKRIKGGKQ